LETETFLSTMTSILTAHSGTLIAYAIAPITGSLVLEGLVLAFRKRGMKPLLVAVLLFVGTIAAGLVIQEVGLSGMAHSPTYLQDASAIHHNESLFLSFSIPLGLLAAVIRIVRSLFRK
jgi:hypothetical protein